MRTLGINIITLMMTLCWGASLISPQALAVDHRERPHWHGDIHFFHEHDLHVWRSGHWYHGPHLGALGWWWVVNGIWYPYPRQIAVVPDPYVPSTVVVEQPQPTTVVVQPPTQAPAPAPSVSPDTPPALNWYYCNNPHGYYPYVTQCNVAWTTIPATPPPPPTGN